MKTWNRLFFLLCAGLLLASCQEKTTPPPESAPTAEVPKGKRANFDGIYDHEANNDEFNGEMTIQHLGNDRFSFSISTGTATGCTGNVAGEATIGTDGAAVFSAPDCGSLRFSFDIGKVKVEEKACDANHGMRCAYGGTYNLRQ